MQYFCKMETTSSQVGEGSRVIHFFIDTIIISIITYIVYEWWVFHVQYWHYRPIGFGVFFFLVTWVYCFVFEFLFLRTPAKWLTASKVVGQNGKRPSVLQFIIRASLRTTIISMFGLAWNQKPFHDTLSKTEVIHV